MIPSFSPLALSLDVGERKTGMFCSKSMVLQCCYCVSVCDTPSMVKMCHIHVHVPSCSLQPPEACHNPGGANMHSFIPASLFSTHGSCSHGSKLWGKEEEEKEQ